MKTIKYFFQFLIIFFLFLIFKIFGLKISSNLSSFLFKIFGPFFRPKKRIEKNILKAFPEIKSKELKKIINNMWGNYGRILSEYVFLKDFRKSKFQNNIKIIGQDVLEEIKKNNKPVVFISGHFNNFELMAMHIEKSGIELAAVYRPLNNKFLNPIMEYLRKNFICKNQIKKGLGGVREIIKAFSQNTSVAMMIDQRVTEGEKSILFNKDTFTTTIPAQLVKKYNCPVVPIYIKRRDNIYFDITIEDPIYFNKFDDIKNITLKLNKWLEKKILLSPDQWIWTHNKWKL